jgi:hypothetical protein
MGPAIEAGLMPYSEAANLYMRQLLEAFFEQAIQPA